jgi:CheY-like chemotaxis protein
VLVVEDNDVNREITLAMLAGMGVTTGAACDGVEALEALSQTDYDLVFMDCQMPRMDGYAACARLRELEARRSQPRRTPVVALTAAAFEEDRERCRAAGMDDHLSKPFEEGQLAVTLSRWLSKRPGRPLAE